MAEYPQTGTDQSMIFELKVYVSVVNVQIRVYPLYEPLLRELIRQNTLKLEHISSDI